MVNKLLETLDRHSMILPGMRICICLSGGADSCALLDCLMRLKSKLNFDLVACHFNHHIRLHESDQDEQFCISLCKTMGISLYIGGADVPLMRQNSGCTLEEVARDARYAWFDSLAKLHSIDRFATAHHQDDQAETVLFRLLRGTSPVGLSGISPVRGKYIRPFINISKKEILEYIDANDLTYVEDRTNLDTKYTRNYIRHSLMPFAERINPNSCEAISRVSSLIREDNEFLESLLPAYMDRQYVVELHDSLLRRIIYRNFLKKTECVLPYKHLDKIFLAVKKSASFCYQINKEWNAVFADGFLSFERRSVPLAKPCLEGSISVGECVEHSDFLRISLDCSSSLHAIESKIFFAKNVYNLSTELLLSSDKICGMVRYRTRCPGDTFLFKGHHRSIKKMMCDHKIPLAVRSLIPIIYDDIGVLCVPFLGVSDRVYCNDQNSAIKLRVEIAYECN